MEYLQTMWALNDVLQNMNYNSMWKPKAKQDTYHTITEQAVFVVGQNSEVDTTRFDLKVWRSNSDRREVFRTPPYRPWVPPSLLWNGYRVSLLQYVACVCVRACVDNTA